MKGDRRLLVWLVVGLGLLAAATLWTVLGTVFFAVTVVYVVEPLYDRLLDRGVPSGWAATLTTVLVFVAGLVLVVPFVVVLYQRRAAVRDFVETLPEAITVAVGEATVTVQVSALVDMVVAWMGSVAVEVAAASAIVAVKLTVFGVVVLGLLARKDRLTTAIRTAIPDTNLDVYDAMAERTRDTLVAIYVLQAATALATFTVALVVFGLFGYEAPVLLALFAGILQFLPVIGPSILVALIVAYELSLGRVSRAIYVGVVAWVFVAWLPDVVVRPWLAARTAHLPGSLYFVGFTGGLLTVGAIGVIAGPLIVALLLEALTLLAATRTPLQRPLVEGPFH